MACSPWCFDCAATEAFGPVAAQQDALPLGRVRVGVVGVAEAESSSSTSQETHITLPTSHTPLPASCAANPPPACGLLSRGGGGEWYAVRSACGTWCFYFAVTKTFGQVAAQQDTLPLGRVGVGVVSADGAERTLAYRAFRLRVYRLWHTGKGLLVQGCGESRGRRDERVFFFDALSSALTGVFQGFRVAEDLRQLVAQHSRRPGRGEPAFHAVVH